MGLSLPETCQLIHSSSVENYFITTTKLSMQFQYDKRIRALRSSLKKHRLSALVAVTIEDSSKNVRYLSGFGGTTGALVITERNTVLAVDARYTLRAKAEAIDVEVVTLPVGAKRIGSFIDYVSCALTNARVSKNGRVGFEGMRVPYQTAEAWKSYFTQTLVSTNGFTESLRQRKDSDEIRALRRAGSLTSKVFIRVSKVISADQTEKEVATLIDTELRRAGAHKNSFDTIVASGPNSAVPHHETGTRKLKAGDPVVLDFGGVFSGGYCSDLTRTIFVRGKKPNAQLQEMYRIVLEANKRALRALRTGMMWKEYDAVARSYIEQKGYGKYFTHGLGHSLGLEAHDPFDYAKDLITEGVVLTDEPGIYVAGLGGVRIEDDVVVTKDGARRLTPAPYLAL
jgi:Xaa-Pro aminopeptidase